MARLAPSSLLELPRAAAAAVEAVAAAAAKAVAAAMEAHPSVGAVGPRLTTSADRPSLVDQLGRPPPATAAERRRRRPTAADPGI